MAKGNAAKVGSAKVAKTIKAPMASGYANGMAPGYGATGTQTDAQDRLLKNIQPKGGKRRGRVQAVLATKMRINSK